MNQFDDNLLENAQRYCKGEMNGEELARFRVMLLENEALAAEVDSYRRLRFTLKNKSLIEANMRLEESVKGIVFQPDFENLDDFPSPETIGNPARKNFEKYLLAGIIGIALLAILWWKLTTPSFVEPQKVIALTAPYLEPFENVISLAPGENSILALGMKAYDEGKYPEAIQQLSRYLSDTENDNVRLYLGISYVLTRQFEEGIAVLSDLSTKNETFSPAAKWYLSLALLQKSQIMEASLLLQQLQNDPVFGEQATNLQQALRK